MIIVIAKIYNDLQMNQQERIKQLLTTGTKQKYSEKSLKQDSIRKIIIGALMATTLIFTITKLFDGPLTNEQVSIVNENKQSFPQQRTHKHIASLLKSPINFPECNATIPKIDKNNKFYSSFLINGPQISYRGPSQKWTQLVGYKKIPFNELYKVKAQIIYSINQHIMFGITNKKRIKSQSSFFNEDTYAYYGHNGCLWAEGRLLSKDEKGFDEKQIVQVTVKLNEGIVQWTIQGVLVGQVYSENLKDQSKEFVPYFQMFEKDDLIRALL